MVDPLGLLTTGQNFAIGAAGTAAALGGPLFGWAIGAELGAKGLVMAGFGDFMHDLIWAKQPPPWNDKPCQ